MTEAEEKQYFVFYVTYMKRQSCLFLFTVHFSIVYIPVKLFVLSLKTYKVILFLFMQSKEKRINFVQRKFYSFLNKVKNVCK